MKLSSIEENNCSQSKVVWHKKFDKKVQNLSYAHFNEPIDKSFTQKGELFNHIRVQLVSTSAEKSHLKRKKEKQQQQWKQNFNGSV